MTTSTPEPSVPTAPPTLEELVEQKRRSRHPSPPTPDDIRTRIIPPYMEEIAAALAALYDAKEELDAVAESGDTSTLPSILPEARAEIEKIFGGSELWEGGVLPGVATRSERRTAQKKESGMGAAIKKVFTPAPQAPNSRNRRRPTKPTNPT